jgi:AraC-like DNA-binding protein
MLLKDFSPAKELLEFVRCYRIVHFTFDSKDLPPAKPYTPRPENCLSFYPYDTEVVEYTETNKSVANLPVALIGQHLEVTNRYIGCNFLCIQVIFQNGALYRLSGIPLSELLNEYLPADFVFKKEIYFVNEQLYYSNSYQEMVTILDDFVTQLARKSKKDAHPIDMVAKLLLPNLDPINLENSARKAFLSTKQYERKFKERTGVNPKLFQKLVRFDHAFRTRNARPDLDWRSIAFDCNYYDYQHLVKDYKAFTGFTPAEFHNLGSPEEKLGIAESYYEMEMSKIKNK